MILLPTSRHTCFTRPAISPIIREKNHPEAQHESSLFCGHTICRIVRLRSVPLSDNHSTRHTHVSMKWEWRRRRKCAIHFPPFFFFQAPLSPVFVVVVVVVVVLLLLLLLLLQ
eukprot:scaffold2479_cov151-Amphora_coffeaeformis.AAC.3